jgi:hypothetical protein
MDPPLPSFVWKHNGDEEPKVMESVLTSDLHVGKQRDDKYIKKKKQ